MSGKVSKAAHAAIEEKSPPALTRNQLLVLDALQNADEPVSAYCLLDQLRDQGLRAPLQVYRALDRLIELGRAHRLASLNAFVACRHGNCANHGQSAFAICRKCGKVREVAGHAIADMLVELVENQEFHLEQAIIELSGLCQDCGP